MSAIVLVSLLRGHHLRVERQHDQRQRAVFRQQLAADDLVGLHSLDELGVVGALGQLSGEQRRRQLARRRRLPRREQRDQPAGAVDQLQIGDEVAQLLQIPRASRFLPSTTTRTSNSLRREFLGHLFVLMEFLGVGAEQLAQRIVDLDAIDAEHRADHQDREDDAGQHRRLHRDQAKPLQPERDAFGRRLLDLLDMDFIVAGFFEHALSNSHIGSGFTAKFGDARMTSKGRDLLSASP